MTAANQTDSGATRQAIRLLDSANCRRQIPEERRLRSRRLKPSQTVGAEKNRREYLEHDGGGTIFEMVGL